MHAKLAAYGVPISRKYVKPVPSLGKIQGTEVRQSLFVVVSNRTTTYVQNLQSISSTTLVLSSIFLEPQSA